MEHFCTYFDINFLTRGLTLYRSLREYAGPFTLWVLCLDDRTMDHLEALQLPHLRPISIRTLEEADPDLRAVKSERSRIEYYFTSSPCWPQYLIDRVPGLSRITYLDADLRFYSSPAPIFAEMEGKSILIVGHRFPDRLRQREKFGIFNVGLVSFRADEQGRRCLRDWRTQCLDWCFDRLEDGKFADQKYLDDWPDRYSSVHVLQHPGAGLAPWNWMNYDIRTDGSRATVDGEPLIFYHFHGVRQLSRRWYDSGTTRYGSMPRHLVHWLYDPYVEELQSAAEQVEQCVGARVPRNRLRGYREGFARRLRWAITSGVRGGLVRQRDDHRLS
jgi:hypothetical protein